MSSIRLFDWTQDAALNPIMWDYSRVRGAGINTSAKDGLLDSFYLLACSFGSSSLSLSLMLSFFLDTSKQRRHYL